MQHFLEGRHQKAMAHLLQKTGYVWFKVSTGYMVKQILTLLTFTMMSLETYAFKNNRHYVHNAAHDDVFVTDKQIAVFEAESKLMCLMLCNHNAQCQSISYNSISMRCQHFLVTFWNRQNITGTNEIGWMHYDPFKGADCTDLYKKQFTTGVYTIFPGNMSYFSVKCEMDVDGGGWTVIQQRFDGSVDFQRIWMEYKSGFGDLKGEFWLGNDQLHVLTSSADYELRIDISDWHGNNWYAVYKTFKVGDEISQYKLTIGNYNGTAGDDMAVHNGMKFSTMDRDNDEHSTVQCSQVWGGNGGWWYNACDDANLNSIYGEDIGEQIGIEWTSALGKNITFTLKTTRMMIRRL